MKKISFLFSFFCFISFTRSLFIVKDRTTALIRKSITSNTARGYGSSWNNWISFLSEKQLRANKYLVGVPIEEQRRLLVFFIDCMNHQNKDPNRIVGGLRHEFLVNCQSVSIFADPAVKAALRGCSADGRSKSMKKMAKLRAPTPYVFIEWIRSEYWRDDPVRAMTYLGIMIQYTFLLRPCEVAYDSDTRMQHTIMSEDVAFTNHLGLNINPWEVTRELHSNIEEVAIIVRSTKVDKSGRGLLLFVSRRNQYEEMLVQDLLDWCAMANLSRGDMFFSRNRMNMQGLVINKKLTRHMISTALKAAAVHHNLPQQWFSAHCQRIGGATDLKQLLVGEGQFLSKEVGNWNTEESAKLYQRSSSRDINSLVAVNAGKNLSLDDIKRMFPFAEHRTSKNQITSAK